jgi:osmotically-inducible protein OsmY
MNPPRSSLPLLALAVFAGGEFIVRAQVEPRREAPAQTASSAPRPELVVLSAIRSHPLTAPYPIVAIWQKDKVVLAGRVGTKQVHDTAVRLAIAAGYPFRDELVIDTGMAHLVSQSAAATGGGIGGPLGTQSAASPYVYPEPLFSWMDDPFFGMVPPIISYPPWWRSPRMGGMPQAQTAPNYGVATTQPPRPAGSPNGGRQQLETDPVKGQVDISVDISGQVFLRGVAASNEAAREIEEAARSVPGVTNVFNQLEVIPRRAPADAEDPPPPPAPEPFPAGPAPTIKPASPVPPIAPSRPNPAPAAAAPAALDSQPLTRRVVSSLERRPVAAELPIKVRSAEGVVTLTGKVPTTYEAMMAYRAAQQTPGVHEIIDRLEFTVPDEDHTNPLLDRGRPDDIEPYLASQIRRHIGDLAHIDRVQANGNVLELRGTIASAADQERLVAILRSMPVLQGFRLETKFIPE